MVHAAVLCAGLLIALVGDAPDSSRDLKTYEALKAKVGKGPQAQVKLALWCEAHGLNAERVEHLARAALSDPKNVMARGLLGLVAFGGRWESADKIGERARADEKRNAKLAEYEGRRDKLAEKEASIRKLEEHYKAMGRPGAADATRLKGNRELVAAAAREWAIKYAYATRLEGIRELERMHAQLGLWCEENGLKPEAIAHFTTAVHLNPYRESSWRHLGCVKRNGRWMRSGQAAAEERDEHEQRVANRHWEPLLTKWKHWLGDPASTTIRRAEAREHLATVTDPRAISPILEVFHANGSETEQTWIVRLLGQIDAPRSSRILAELAVMTHSRLVPQEAIAILKDRPRRDYAGHLVEMIHGEIHYWVKPVEGPGSAGALVFDTPRFHLVRTYDAPPVVKLASTFWGYIGYDGNGLPVIAQGIELSRLRRERDSQTAAADVRELEARTAELVIEANIKAQVARQRLIADLTEIAMFNERVEKLNPRIIAVLQLAADAPQELTGADEDAWRVWWYDKLGYSYQPAPQVIVRQNAVPQVPPPYFTTCFAAGTPVYTLDGPRPIETVQVGDQVLSQDATSGALSFQLVMVLHHNPPGKTLRVSLSSGESLVCSVYHRFWRANRGWAMARELAPGDALRVVGGLVRVAKVEPDSVQPLYNLDVSGPHTFFAGTSQALVHDNTLPDHRLEPFDALPTLEVATRPK